MSGTLEYFVSALVTLLVVVDPIGLAPTFLGITQDWPGPARRQVATRATAIAGGILLGTVLVGKWLLATLAISLDAFRIAGGLLLFSIASEMAFGLRIERQARQAAQAMEEQVRNLAAFPLAIPLMAGPGAITAAVLLAGQADRYAPALALLVLAVVLVMLASLATFIVAARFGRLLGATGNIVLSRLLGVLLAALSVQYVIDGIRGVL